MSFGDFYAAFSKLFLLNHLYCYYQASVVSLTCTFLNSIQQCENLGNMPCVNESGSLC